MPLVTVFDCPMQLRILVLVTWLHYRELTWCRPTVKVEATRFAFQSIYTFFKMALRRGWWRRILIARSHITTRRYPIGYRLRRDNWDTWHNLIPWLHHGLLISILHRLIHHWLSSWNLSRVHPNLHRVLPWGQLLPRKQRLLRLLSRILRGLLSLHKFYIKFSIIIRKM